MRRLPVEAERQSGVFTTAQAYRAGWKQDQLDYAVRRGQLVRYRRGAYAEPSTLPRFELERLTLLQNSVAAALTVNGAVVSHCAAAVAHDLPLLAIPTLACVTLPPGVRTHQHRLHLHRQRLESSVVTMAGGISVTSASRSCLDIAREHGLRAALVVADAALATGKATSAQLRIDYASLRGTRSSVDARLLCELADGRSESPLESASRLTLHELGEHPQIQVPLFSNDYAFLGRVDFFWPELGVVGEADGKVKYAGPEALGSNPLWHEKRRQDGLTARNLVVARWSWRETNDPPLLARQLERAFTQARTLRAAGLYPQIKHAIAS